MKVTDPIDKTDLSYAIEALITEAREHGMEDEEIREVLDIYERAFERGDI